VKEIASALIFVSLSVLAALPLAEGAERKGADKREWPTHGWAKDMDLYTRDGDSIEPLPTAGKHRAERERLHARYNNRFASGR